MARDHFTIKVKIIEAGIMTVRPIVNTITQARREGIVVTSASQEAETMQVFTRKISPKATPAQEDWVSIKSLSTFKYLAFISIARQTYHTAGSCQ